MVADIGKNTAKELLVEYLRQAMSLRAVRATDPHAADFIALKRWQSDRLARTYADLLASERYRPAAQFFLTELYGPKDFTQRDVEVARVMPLMTRMLPASALATLAEALRMDALSESLDNDMVAALRAAGREGSIDNIDDRAYAEAYRSCARTHDRELQITLVDDIGSTLDRLTHVPMVYAMLKLMRGPCELAGLANLQSFLQSGFEAFRHMKEAKEFLACVMGRETAIMQDIFAGRHELLSRVDWPGSPAATPTAMRP